MRLLDSLFGNTGQRRPNPSRFNSLVSLPERDNALPARTIESEESDNLAAALNYNPNQQALAPRPKRPTIVFSNGTAMG